MEAGSDYLDLTPVRQPPPGQLSNLINPVSRSYQVVVVIAVCFVFVLPLSLGRIWTRIKITHSFGVDDWLCIVATICTISYSGLVLSLLDKPGNGILGVHLWDVPLSHLMSYTKASLADSILIRICNTIIKVAFLVFYLRLFNVIRHVRIMAYTGMATVITFCISFMVIDLVACTPWPSEHDGWLDKSMLARCNSIAPNLVTAGAYFNVITNFYILFIPLHTVSTLGLSQKKKIGVSLIFLTGLLACAASLANLIIRSSRKLFDTTDFSWTTVPVYITCIVEINVVLICFSMPAVSVLWLRHLTRIGGSLSSWIRERRARRHGQHESYSNVESSESKALQLPPEARGTMTRMLTFIRNLYRSQAESSRHEPTLPTCNHRVSTDYSYHFQLKSMQPSQNRPITGDKERDKALVLTTLETN